MPTTAARPHTDKDALFKLIGERIRKAREAKGYKQDVLGELAGQSAVTISRWESATRRPSVDDLIVLADALEKPITYFTEATPPEEDAVVQLARTARQLDDQDVRELQEYADFRRLRHVRRRIEGE